MERLGCAQIGSQILPRERVSRVSAKKQVQKGGIRILERVSSRLTCSSSSRDSSGAGEDVFRGSVSIINYSPLPLVLTSLQAEWKLMGRSKEFSPVELREQQQAEPGLSCFPFTIDSMQIESGMSHITFRLPRRRTVNRV